MFNQSILHTYKRYRTLQTHEIKVLPVAILMPHSACNCRCVMCDIWKGNKNAKQLTPQDIEGLLVSLKKLGTKRVVMSGGEALLNTNFFGFCEFIKAQGIKITLLSTGITLHHHAAKVVSLTDEVIVSLDGDEEKHNEIRNITDAFSKLRDGVQALKKLQPAFPVSARCVIHNYNFGRWNRIVLAAKEMGLDSISFLPADVSSTAFNRDDPWDASRQNSVLIPQEKLPDLLSMVEQLKKEFNQEFETRFIIESPEKIHKIYQYYAAQQGLADFPYKTCNAPWVSAVVEADGKVRPCFFHDSLGSIKEKPLHQILNSAESITYRKSLDVQKNETCIKCVCYLNLHPRNSSY